MSTTICWRTELAAAAALGRGSGAVVPRPATERLERVCAWRLFLRSHPDDWRVRSDRNSSLVAPSFDFSGSA